jgi:hypothetical protein
MYESEFSKIKERALAEPTLEEALALVAVWEMERVVKVVQANGGPYDSCFKYIFKLVIEEYGSSTDTP